MAVSVLAKQPHILFIVADDYGWDMWGELKLGPHTALIRWLQVPWLGNPYTSHGAG